MYNIQPFQGVRPGAAMRPNPTAGYQMPGGGASFQKPWNDVNYFPGSTPATPAPAAPATPYQTWRDNYQKNPYNFAEGKPAYQPEPYNGPGQAPPFGMVNPPQWMVEKGWTVGDDGRWYPPGTNPRKPLQIVAR